LLSVITPRGLVGASKISGPRPEPELMHLCGVEKKETGNKMGYF